MWRVNESWRRVRLILESVIPSANQSILSCIWYILKPPWRCSLRTLRRGQQLSRTFRTINHMRSASELGLSSVTGHTCLAFTQWYFAPGPTEEVPLLFDTKGTDLRPLRDGECNLREIQSLQLPDITVTDHCRKAMVQPPSPAQASLSLAYLC